MPPDKWKHCPGMLNPADIPSRGVSTDEMQEKIDLWLHGPENLETVDTLPEECAIEMKAKD